MTWGFFVNDDIAASTTQNADQQRQKDSTPSMQPPAIGKALLFHHAAGLVVGGILGLVVAGPVMESLYAVARVLPTLICFFLGGVLGHLVCVLRYRDQESSQAWDIGLGMLVVYSFLALFASIPMIRTIAESL